MIFGHLLALGGTSEACGGTPGHSEGSQVRFWTKFRGSGTSFWEPGGSLGRTFWCFFVIFWYTFSHCVLGRPPDHFFIDFGVILAYILEYFSMLFPRYWKPWKMKPLWSEITVFEVMRAPIFMIVWYAFQCKFWSSIFIDFLVIFGVPGTSFGDLWAYIWRSVSIFFGNAFAMQFLLDFESQPGCPGGPNFTLGGNSRACV